MKTASMAKSPEKGRGNVCDTIRGSVIGAVEGVFMVLGVVDGGYAGRLFGALVWCVSQGSPKVFPSGIPLRFCLLCRFEPAWIDH